MRIDSGRNVHDLAIKHSKNAPLTSQQTRNPPSTSQMVLAQNPHCREIPVNSLLLHSVTVL